MSAPYEGLMEVFLSGHAVSIGRSDRRGWILRLVPFNGTMFLDTPYSIGPGAEPTTYQLSLSGTGIGTYARGGGPDGDYDTFKIESAEIRGAFDQTGLSVSVVVRTFAAYSTCWSTGENEGNIHEPIEVTLRFLVPLCAAP